MKRLIESLNLGNEETVILMPVTRVLLEERMFIGNLALIPPGELRFQDIKSESNNLIGFRKGLVGFQSAVTGFSKKIFNNVAIVGFKHLIDWSSVTYNSHDDDIELLSKLSAIAERSFDLLRLDYCELGLPESLPGPIGVWEHAGPYLGAILYYPSKNKWHQIAGASRSFTSITAGIGLDLHNCKVGYPPSASSGEVGAITIHALELLSDAMYSRNDTSKFIRTMTLLEFLASPDDYKPWKKIKGDILCHVAKNKEDYLLKTEKLGELLSRKNETGQQTGLRTLIVHHGRFLEDIVKVKIRRRIFRELQMYVQYVVKDMIKHCEMNWAEFVDYRNKLKNNLGIS